MASNELCAVAIDLGASSLRFAKGTFDGRHIAVEFVAQEPNVPLMDGEREAWDWSTISRFLHSASDYAATGGDKTTIGVDTWGVDHGFIGKDHKLIAPPICYRDKSHQHQFDIHADWRQSLFHWTGIQHQPFNTIYQLCARLSEEPGLPDRVANILLLPDLAAWEIGAEIGCEWTHASTSQMLDTGNAWCLPAFELCGWPNRFAQCSSPGAIVGKTKHGNQIVRVAGHDTASAVVGLGTLATDQAFLNLGSWSILGCILDSPILSANASKNNFSNERAADGRVRFLKNIPGFYVINRLHAELGLDYSVADWLKRANLSVSGRIDLFDPSLFHPCSMLAAVSERLADIPTDASSWAGIALMSLADCIAAQLEVMHSVTGKEFYSLRVAGGGSKSAVVLQAISDACARTVIAGPDEATVLGNLGMQFVASGAVPNLEALSQVILSSLDLNFYSPRT